MNKYFCPRYLRSGCLALCLMSAMVRADLWAAQSTDKNLKEMRDKITATDLRARQYEQDADILDGEIAGLSRALVTSAGKIQTAEEAVNGKEDRLHVLKLRERERDKNLRSNYDHMAKTLGAMQRLSQQPAELVAYRPDKAINSLRSASLLKMLQPELQKRGQTIRQDIVRLGEVRRQIIREREELSILLAALTGEQIDMNQLLAKRRQRQEELRAATRSERRKLKIFAAKAKNLQDLMARIKKEARAREEKKQKAALAAAKRQADKPSPNKPAGTKRAKERLDSLPGGRFSFARAKGTLPLPARGSIGRKFGAITPEGQSSEGITIMTRSRAMVVAPHDGRVVFAGKFRSYGQLLIISHGPEYHTLLAGIDRLDAEVGQWVLKGEPIGQMADGAKKTGLTENFAGRSLYVELRRRGKPINPLPWIAGKS